MNLTRRPVLARTLPLLAAAGLIAGIIVAAACGSKQVAPIPTVAPPTAAPASPTTAPAPATRPPGPTSAAPAATTTPAPTAPRPTPAAMPASAPTPEPSPEPLSLQQGLDQLDVATIDLADLPIFPDLDALQIGGFTMPTHLVGPPAASLDSVPATSAAR